MPHKGHRGEGRCPIKGTPRNLDAVFSGDHQNPLGPHSGLISRPSWVRVSSKYLAVNAGLSRGFLGPLLFRLMSHARIPASAQAAIQA